MSEKFQNKYRIPSARRKNWDYGDEAIYFVTICTKDRIHYFGEIQNPSDQATVSPMVLSDLGKIAECFWNEIPIHFSHIILGEYTIMPNHIHGLICIANQQMPLQNTCPELQNDYPFKDNPQDDPKQNLEISRKWKSGVLGVIINQFKRKCTIEARKRCLEFAWQTRFHDHIVRNEESLQLITNYIINNPTTWAEDKFNVSP